MSPQQTDFAMSDQGSIFLFTPLTPAAETWWAENVGDGAMTFGTAFVVEHRYARDIADGIVADGLTVE